jgi:hypothetical protein
MEIFVNGRECKLACFVDAEFLHLEQRQLW